MCYCYRQIVASDCHTPIELRRRKKLILPWGMNLIVTGKEYNIHWFRWKSLFFGQDLFGENAKVPIFKQKSRLHFNQTSVDFSYWLNEIDVMVVRCNHFYLPYIDLLLSISYGLRAHVISLVSYNNDVDFIHVHEKNLQSISQSCLWPICDILYDRTYLCCIQQQSFQGYIMEFALVLPLRQLVMGLPKEMGDSKII